jgi:hypothetical protein
MLRSSQAQLAASSTEAFGLRGTPEEREAGE